jgi:hypothetical protein
VLASSLVFQIEAYNAKVQHGCSLEQAIAGPPSFLAPAPAAMLKQWESYGVDLQYSTSPISAVLAL